MKSVITALGGDVPEEEKKEGEEGTPEMMEEAMMEGGDIDIKDFPKTVLK